MAERTSDPAIRGLTAEQVESFNENGFLGPFDLYADDEAPLVWSQAMIEMVTSANKPHNSTTINCDRHLDCDTLSRNIAQPAIVHKLRSLMGDDIMCWKTHIFEKEPGGSGTGWHQVDAFTPLVSGLVNLNAYVLTMLAQSLGTSPAAILGGFVKQV